MLILILNVFNFNTISYFESKISSIYLYKLIQILKLFLFFYTFAKHREITVVLSWEGGLIVPVSAPMVKKKNVPNNGENVM